MSKEKTTLTREALFDLIWSKPMREVAPTLAISDVGLAKVCKRLNIPTPKQGHWLRDKRLRAKRPALPKISKGMPTTVNINKKNETGVEIPVDLPLPVISTKTTYHSLVRDCRKSFTRAEPNEFGRLLGERQDIQVSRASLPRALALLNTIVCSVLELGYQANYSKEHKMIELKIENEIMRLSLFEPANRSVHILTKKEEQKKAKYGRVWTPRWDHIPSGKLALTISGRGLYGIQTQWKDRKTESFELMLPTIIQCFLAAADWIKSKRCEGENRARLWAKAERRRRQEARAATLTDERLAAVEALVNGRHRALQIRECISDVYAKSSITELPATKRRLLRWAELLARHYDPADPFELPRLKPSGKKWNL